jgi:hypothetical protein
MQETRQYLALAYVDVWENIQIGCLFNHLLDHMSFPHPQSGEDQELEDDELRGHGVFGQVLERTTDIPRERDGQDQVYPMGDRAFGGCGHVDVFLVDQRTIPNCFSMLAIPYSTP